MSHNTVFAAELSWPDYDALVRDGSVPILLPIGSMEQHGHHMPMNVDVLLPVEFARRVAERTGALVAPPFTYGYKSHQKSGGGHTAIKTGLVFGHSCSPSRSRPCRRARAA